MVYLNFPVDDMDDFMGSFGRLLNGFSVTMPHKQAIMAYLNECDAISRKISAINTVTNLGGHLLGCNTDTVGVVKPLLQRTELKDKRVTLLGAGGAARAAAAALLEQGARVTILNRTIAKAEAACQTSSAAHQAGWMRSTRMTTDILVNMTSMGMHPDIDETPIPAEKLHDLIVFDGVYNPPETKLLRTAAQAGCTVIPGIEMFINQAAEQFRLWTEIEPDLKLMQEILS